MAHYDENENRAKWHSDEVGVLEYNKSWWEDAIRTSLDSMLRLTELNSLIYGERANAPYAEAADSEGWHYNYGRDDNEKMGENWCLLQVMGPLGDSEGWVRKGDGVDIKYNSDFRLDDFIDANGRHIEDKDFREKYTNNSDWTAGKIDPDIDWVYLYGALEYIKTEKYTEFDGNNEVKLINNPETTAQWYDAQIRWHFSSRGYQASLCPETLTCEWDKYSLCDAAQRLIRKILKNAIDSPYADTPKEELHAILTKPFDPFATEDTDPAAATMDTADGVGSEYFEPAPEWGITEEEYEELVDEGKAIVACDDPPIEETPEECPVCEKDPNASVPNWRFQEEGDVFLNGKTCEYCVTVDSGETDASILNDAASRDTFLEEQKTKGLELILEHFDKDNVTADTMTLLKESVVAKQYDVPMRPLMQIRVLVCIPVELIEALQIVNTDAPEEAPVGPAGCVLMAQDVRTMIKRVQEAFRYYGHRYALWSWDTGQLIPNFSPREESRKLKMFVPALVQLMNRNGFKLNGKNAAEKIEFRFNANYEVIYAQANEVGCEPVELLWKKGGDNLGGFKKLDPINDPRTMAYIAALNDMHTDAAARDPKAWDEFFAKYTYPDINVYLEDVPDPIGDPVMADGPLQQAAQAIVDDIVGLPDALISKLSDSVCRDRSGQYNFDAEVNNFEDLLKKAMYVKNKQLQVGDDTFLNLPELLAETSSLDELYTNILNKLKICGLLDLLSTATACLTSGIDLEESLSIIVKAALKAMDPGNLEKLFIGLPADKQAEIKQKIASEFGSIPAPWESGYRPGAYSYKIELNDDGTPIGEEQVVPLATTAAGDITLTVQSAEDDNRTVAERTAQYRMETQGTEFGGAGSVGTAADNVLDAIFEAYIEAILDSVDAEFLLGELNKFPGAELITKVLMNPECPPPPLFNPPLGDFLKTLELDFCRGNFDITFPKFQKVNIPDLMKLFMDALLEVLTQLAIKIIMTILGLILKLLLNGICNLLGLLGEMVGSLFANEESNNFAASIKDSISNTGLDALGFPVPLGDDEAINNAAANLFASFSRSCTKPEDLPTGDEASDFIKEIGIVLTQGEFIDLLEGVAADEVYSAIYQLALLRHQSFLCIFPNVSSIKAFFNSLGSMIDPDFMTRGERGQPVFPGVCSDVSGSKNIDNLRRQLLQNQGLNEELINEQIELLKCQAESDLEDLAKFANEGLSMPPLMSDGCTPGIIPRDPSAEVLPSGPVGMLKGPFGVFEGAFDIMDKVYYRDLMGRGGFLNMVLSDKDGRSRRNHDAYVAFASVFGILSPRPNSHEELLPETVARYLEWALKNPSLGQSPNGSKFMEKNFSPDGVAGTPDMILKYSNYFPGSKEEWYKFQLKFLASDYDSPVLNNNYRIQLDEEFNFSEDPAVEEVAGSYSESLVIDTDPGLPEGVQEFIEQDLGLDIEAVLNTGTPEGTPAAALSPQAVVFGKYIEKILKDATPQSALNHPDGVALENLSYIADACMTDMFNYINTSFFNFIAGTIAKSNMAFDYGEGGSAFDGNKPIKYAPTKIFLDETHVHPGPGNPDTTYDGDGPGQSVPLDPLAWGGNETFPAYYEQPAQDRPGWCGIADKMIPEKDACDPKRENIIGFKNISDYATDFYQDIADDDRLNQPNTCSIEAPCDKILARAAAAMLEGNLKATIRIYAAEAFLKGMPAFVKFKADLNELYGDPMTAYITQTLKDGFYLYSRKGFGRRRNDEYYFQFLEQCVQNFGRKIDAGLIEPTQEESEAIEVINTLQGIWKKDTSPASGKPYASTGEKLKRVLSPGYFGVQLMTLVRGNSSTADNIMSAKEGEKLKEESWDYFMREIEPQAEIILKRYIAEELKYVSDEFSSRIPPEYRTLYEVLLGHNDFGCWGNLDFTNAVPTGKPDADINPFGVIADALAVDTDENGIPESDATGELMNMLHLYWDPSVSPSAMNRANPASVVTAGPNEELKSVYWPFVLEQFIEIEDYDVSDLDPASDAIEIWQSIVMERPSNLFGVVRAADWNKYLQDNSALFTGYTRGDLWKSWKYGLRIVFVPPNTASSIYVDDKGDVIPHSEEFPSTSITMPKSTNIKGRITGWSAYTDSGTTPFSEATIQENKAFFFKNGEKSLDIHKNPMSIPLAKGYLDIPMDLSCLNEDYLESYDESPGGFAALVQNLTCSPEYKMLFRYCFNMPRMLSVVGIYIIQAFLPSIGKAGTEPVPEREIGSDTKLTSPSTGDDNDGWYEPHPLFNPFGNYYGGGLSLFPTALNFKNWNFYKSFFRTKKMAAQSFMDTYNSENPNYTSDAYSDTSIQDDAKKSLSVSWPKFNIRLWSKEVDRPYDKYGDLCFDPDEDYKD